jgi:hypothetical protein
MQVLLLDDDENRHEALMTAFLKAGCQITATANFKVAETILRYGFVDLLVATERLRDRLTHGTALLAEYRNPSVATIVISERVGADVEELYDLIPSVHCIVGAEVPAATILALGRASVISQAGAFSFSKVREDSPRRALGRHMMASAA